LAAGTFSSVTGGGAADRAEVAEVAVGLAPIASEAIAVSDFLDNPSVLNAVVVGASLVDLGSVAKVTAKELRTLGQEDFRASRQAALKENGGICNY